MEDISNVRVTRVINASIEQVFDAWTDAEQMKHWYSPEGMSTPEATSECNKDGEYAVTMKMGEMTFKMHGKYLEFERPTKLVFTWESAKEGAMSSDSDVNGYSVLQAANIEKATKLLLGHPHVMWAEGCSVEVFESLALPGM